MEKLFPATDKAQIDQWLSIHSSTRCQTTLMLWWLQLDSSWYAHTMQSAHTVELVLYVCSWHDGSTKSENVLTKSFMLYHMCEHPKIKFKFMIHCTRLTKQVLMWCLTSFTHHM